MFNRSGVIALAIAAAVVAWGALHKDDPAPGSTRSSTSERTSRGSHSSSAPSAYSQQPDAGRAGEGRIAGPVSSGGSMHARKGGGFDGTR